MVLCKNVLSFSGPRAPEIDGGRYTYHTYEQKRQVRLSYVYRKKRLLYIAFCTLFLVITYRYIKYPWPAAVGLVVLSLGYGLYRYFRKKKPYDRKFWVDSIDYILIAYLIYITGGLKSVFFIAFIIPTLAATIRFKMKAGLYGIGLTIGLTGLIALTHTFDRNLQLPFYLGLLFGLGTMVFAAWTIGNLFGDEQERNIELYLFSVTDPLTGLFHFGYARERINEEILRCSRDGGIFSIIFIDMDRFKEVNDRYGHLIGDEVVSHIAAVLQSVLRGGDVLSRYGGDEFLILLPGAGLEEAEKTLQRLFKALQRQPYYLDRTPLFVGFSGGAAEYPEEGRNLEQLLQVADHKMYRQKRKSSSNSNSNSPLAQPFI